MKRTCIFLMSWRLLIAVLAGTSALFGQVALAAAEAQNAAPTIFLSGPDGDHLTLVRSAGEGWQLQSGWNAGSTGWSKAKIAALEAPPLAPQETLERPLTVFVDGPTGFTFIYVLDEGWKFVGRVVDGAR